MACVMRRATTAVWVSSCAKWVATVMQDMQKSLEIKESCKLANVCCIHLGERETLPSQMWGRASQELDSGSLKEAAARTLRCQDRALDLGLQGQGELEQWAEAEASQEQPMKG